MGAKMEFEEFCDYVKEHIKEYLPMEYQECEVVINKVAKINMGELTGMTLIPPGGSGGPTIYLEDFFHDEYEAGRSIEEILEHIVDTVFDSLNLKPDFVRETLQMIGDFSEVRERIAVHAVGYEKNREMLEMVPHQVMGDLAATYRIYLNQTKGDLEGTILITHDMMKAYNTTPEQLHEIALKNSMKAMPAELHTMQSVIEELARDIDDVEIPEMDRTPMLVLTNKQKHQGAATVFYPDVLENLGIPIEEYYIIPSSVHELILLPKSVMNPEGLNAMIQEINQYEVPSYDVLSNKAHEYDPVTKKLVIAGTLQRDRGTNEQTHHMEADTPKLYM